MNRREFFKGLVGVAASPAALAIEVPEAPCHPGHCEGVKAGGVLTIRNLSTFDIALSDFSLMDPYIDWVECAHCGDLYMVRKERHFRGSALTGVTFPYKLPGTYTLPPEGGALLVPVMVGSVLTWRDEDPPYSNRSYTVMPDLDHSLNFQWQRNWEGWEWEMVRTERDTLS